MAWRLSKNVVKGEIDNRKRGVTTGRVWLTDQPEPINLDLKGDTLKDLAGCLLTFTNPGPEETKDLNLLNPLQKGVVGDMTGSRKVRVPDVSMEEMMDLHRQGKKVPEHIGNCLYIEWFSEANGRVVIESTEYSMDISEPAWEMTDEEQQAQLKKNQEAIVDFLDRLASPGPGEEEHDSGEEEPMDEFQWEKFLKDSDARTDTFGKLLEKYEGHPDQEKLVAREMGWTWLEEAIEADERGKLKPEKSDSDENIIDDELPELEPDPLTEGVDWVRDEDGRPRHPLAMRTSNLATGMFRKYKKKGLVGDIGDEDLQNMIFQTQMTGAKLAGALNGLCYDNDREGGMVVAWLKRALSFLHKAIGASDKVAPKDIVPPQELAAFRAELFTIREEILKLMDRFRHQG